MVLGVDWLSQFNPLMFDFNQSIKRIYHKGLDVEFKGELGDKEFIMIGEEQMNNQVQRQSYGITAQIQLVNEEENELSPEAIQNIIEHYPKVFIEPKGNL